MQSGEAPKEYKAKGEFERANYEMTVATETAAWGFDISPDYNTCQIRYAAVPKTEVSMDKLLNKFDAVRDVFAREGGASDDEFVKHILEQWKKIKVSVVTEKEVNREKTKPYMLVEGECSGSIIKALNLSEMFTFTE